MKRRYFGTDGVRGRFGGPVMNENFAWRLGAAAARFTKTRTDLQSSHVLIGRDTRTSGPRLEMALAAGLQSEELVPMSLGVVPTPVVGLMTRSIGAALGVVITASHNPASDNGIKFFGPMGIKLTDEQEGQVEMFLPESAGPAAAPPVQMIAPLARYLEMATALLPAGSLRGWPIVLDTANGAASVSSRTVLEELGASLTLLGNSPDGQNINAGIGSEHPEQMVARVRATGARLGIAHDGDGDRCVLCDERGEVLDGDEILTMLALHGLKVGTLKNNTLVVTVQSNLGVDNAVRAAGGRVCRSQVGDRYVIERMLAEGAVLGGESSGHVICSEISPTGDGLVAALKVIAIMLETGKPLSELRQVLVKFPQLSLALAVREKKPMESLPNLSRAVSAVESELGATGRVLARYSGTEPKLRLLVEGPADAIVKAAMEKIVAAARSDLEIL